MNKKIRTEAVDALFEAIMCLENKEECYLFFEDVCTVNELLSLSQQPDGSLRSQYPSRSAQVIPSFMLIWVLMLHDHFKANGKDSLTLELLPRAERLMEFMRSQEVDGLLSIEGWNFIDWCKDGSWGYGTPPGGAVNSILNLFYVLALQAISEISSSICL